MKRFAFLLFAGALPAVVAQTPPAPPVPIVPAATAPAAAPAPASQDIVYSKTGGQLAGSISRRVGGNLELRFTSPSGALVSQMIPLANIDHVEFAGDDKIDAILANYQASDLGRLMQAWRSQSGFLDIPKSFAGAYGIRIGQLLLEGASGESAKAASEVLDQVVAKDWDTVRRDHARALNIESLRHQGKQEEAKAAARAFLDEEDTSEESKAEVSYYLALSLADDYRQFLKDNPRWEDDPYMGPKGQHLYNEVLDCLLAPYLRYGAPPDVTSKSLLAATKFLNEFGAQDEAAGLAHDLATIFPKAPQFASSAKVENGNAATTLRELSDFSLAGMDHRLGPGYDFYHPGEPPKDFPDIYLLPVKEEVKGRRYEIGGPWVSKSGDFSSTQGQILYVPDDAENIGVDRVTILEWTNGTYSVRPEPPWNCGSRPEPTSSVWTAAAVGGNPGSPIAIARGMGGWSNCGVAIFSSGLVATAGTVTGHGSDPTFQLPKNKLPTAVSVTNKSEFALVTVVDTDTMKGQIAVLALQSGGGEKQFAHEWPDAYPGLANVAVFTNIKLLGYVDLPGMSFPTGVSAVGSTTSDRLNGRDGNAGMLREYNLANKADREIFLKGGNSSYISKSGWAVVISKSEGKVAFIDLQPLFENFREMYLTSDAKFKMTRDIGPGPKQWPYTFEGDPDLTPKVVATLDQPSPTAVLAALSGGKDARAFVASLDGKIQIYSVGSLATEQPASGAAVQKTGVIQVGKNPVCLTYQKLSTDTFIAVSRGDREIEWVQYRGNSGKVVRRLRDARLLDPVYAEVADTHGAQASLITVADFKGRQILNYLHGEVIFATQGGARFGMGKNGKDEFECGGLMALPGSPFCISASNVN